MITLVYDFYWSVAARKAGALAAFKAYPDIEVDEVGTFTAPEKADGVATAMLTAHPDMKGIFVAWDTPAQQVVAAANTLGRKIVVPTNDLAADSAVNVARGDVLAVGAQQAVAYAEDSDYGLSAYLFTRDNRLIMRAIAELQFGEIYMNRPSGESPHGFHVGYRKSGIGGEDGQHGIEGYMRKKTMYNNFG